MPKTQKLLTYKLIQTCELIFYLGILAHPIYLPPLSLQKFAFRQYFLNAVDMKAQTPAKIAT